MKPAAVPAETEQKRKRRAPIAVEPRLLSDAQSGDYIGASPSYVRQLVANGELKRVELPATNGSGERARKLLIDVRDLDRLVERWKAR